VPMPVFLRQSFPEVLGVGAELKSTVCVTRRGEAFLSQHIGDLENLETLRSFEQSISHLTQILHVAPKLIVHDLHPDYLSTQWALHRTDVPRLAVQHHHAHIAAVIAESKISGPVLGLALDGTGYGGDGTIWGGEILKVDGDQCERLGHFRHLPLPGGNAAIREPWRMALSCLWSLNPDDLESEYGDIVARWPEREVRVVLQMLSRGFNSPLTSSCGRLFDAVAALLGIRLRNVYEGQAAIELEQLADRAADGYSGCIYQEGGSWILDPLPMVSDVLRDKRAGIAPGTIAARFHNGLCDLLGEASRRVGAATGLQRVALSGGVFQNGTLSQRLEATLEKLGFEVHTHQHVPPNDACIALGQAYIGGIRVLQKQ
jgi:hydrogenase maturation protein HypF